MKADIQFRLKISVAVFTILMVLGITGFMVFEKMSLTNAIYFSIVTMATVGYGDIHPQTGIGKMLALIIIIGGVGTFLGVIAGITDLFVNRRQEAIRQQKIDMLTGLFFSEMGVDLIKLFIQFDPDIETLHKVLKISSEWDADDFEKAQNRLTNHSVSVNSCCGDFDALLIYLQNKSGLLIRLIENPIVQEHENFTELLRALFHLRDELLHRNDLTELIDSDRKHLEGDIIRVYKLSILEWLRYIRYLKNHYGYLFSLAIRLNPFDPEATAVVNND